MGKPPHGPDRTRAQPLQDTQLTNTRIVKNKTHNQSYYRALIPKVGNGNIPMLGNPRPSEWGDVKSC